jgi:hypothetical protein
MSGRTTDIARLARAALCGSGKPAYGALSAALRLIFADGREWGIASLYRALGVAQSVGRERIRSELCRLVRRGELRRVEQGLYVSTSAAPSDRPATVTPTEVTSAAAVVEEAAPVRRDDCAGAAELAQEPVAEAPEPEVRRSPAYVSPPLGDRLAEAAERAWEARQRRLTWLGVGR